jgi:nucleotide-binding universal stress UspA family protein
MAETGQKQSNPGTRSNQAVICATRGGPASYPNQDAAIVQAKARGQDIVFVFVTNLQFLDKLSSAVLVDMDEQMKELGEFLLLMAKERAEKMGVRAFAEVRSGSIRQALMDVIRQYDANLVVMGQPGRSANLFKTEHMEDICDYLREEAGVEVMLV